MIEWFARNHVAANLLMVGIMLLGSFTIQNKVALELMPEFNLGKINISTVLFGGNPKSIEATVTTRIEEAIADLEGIKQITSRSSESVSSVSAKIATGYDEKDLLSDIKLRVDALNTLPADAERPTITLLEIPVHVVGVAVYSDTLDYRTLYRTSQQIRQQLLNTQGISQVGELQAPPPEIHIEVTPTTLKAHKLTLQDIALAIQRNAIDLSAGNIKTQNGDILIRADGQAYTTTEFAKIPVITTSNTIITLGQLANIVDGFTETQVETIFDGMPAIVFEVHRVATQSTIDVSKVVHDFVAKQNDILPKGIKLATYWDTAVVVEDRLTTLINSAIQGGILVMLLLTLFLRPAIAFWVSLGIPISFLGSFILMPYVGVSLNMFSMFGFILVLGIVVDDAIVTGENIYRHIRNGMVPMQAAIFGTKEVAVPVTFGVITTMVAFSPLLMIEGVISDIVKQIPLVVIPVLFFSLVESKLILPTHLSTIRTRDHQTLSQLSQWQQQFSHGFERAVIRFYSPLLKRCISNKTITLISAIAIFAIIIALLSSNWVKSSFMPEFEDDAVFVELTMPTTTSYDTTKQHIDHIVNEANKLKQKYRHPKDGYSYINYVIAVAGVSGTTEFNISNNVGMVILEIVSADKRPNNFSAGKLGQELRRNIGDIAGAEKLSISSSFAEFGKPINVVLSGNDILKMNDIAQRVRHQLQQYPGIHDIQDTYSSAKDEIQLKLNNNAESLGLSLAEVSKQVRQAVHGFEAQRIQRHSNEVRVMVHYPLQNRSSLQDIYQLPITATRQPSSNNNTIPLSDIAKIDYGKSPNSIYRTNQTRTLSITADINSKQHDIAVIKADLTKQLDQWLQYQPGITYELDGEAKAQAEAGQSLMLGLMFVLLAIYALLAIPFKSFWQPLIVMSIIPLSFIGAVLGHIIMGRSVSILSFMGMLALTGIVVNDSLVLVDYINKQRAKGESVIQAVLTAGAVRFRPVILTSLTTFVGLMPLMFSNSLQAQGLIPMAISLGYGIIFATLITLILIPVNYLAFHQIGQIISQLVNRKSISSG